MEQIIQICPGINPAGYFQRCRQPLKKLLIESPFSDFNETFNPCMKLFKQN